jgi:hypothetical protein
MVDAVEEQALERCRHPKSFVDLGTHEAFGVTPTPFAEFLRRNAPTFRTGK